MNEQHGHRLPFPVRPSLLASIRKYRKVLLLGAGLGALLGIVVAVTRPVTYTASATILFPMAPSSKLSALTGGGNDADLPSLPLLDGALQVPQPGTSTSTAGILLMSQKTILRVANDFDLRTAWKLPDDAKVIKRFRRELECRAGKNGDLTIRFQDKSRELSYRVVNRLIDELAQQSRELGLNPAEQSEAFLQTQLADAEVKWAKSQRDLLVYSQQHHIVSLPDQAKGLADQFSDLQKNLVSAKIAAAAAYRQANTQAGLANQLITACVDPTAAAGTPTPLADLYQKVKAAESELVLLRDRLTPNHPDVQEKALVLEDAKRRLKAEIERQTALLKSGSSPAVAATVVQVATCQATVDGLLAAQRSLQQQLDALPQEQATYARLTTELEANLDEVKLFREELEKARIIAARNGATFILADPPVLPLQRDPAYRLLFFMVMVILGISIAALFPYFEWAQQQAEYKELRTHMPFPPSSASPYEDRSEREEHAPV